MSWCGDTKRVGLVVEWVWLGMDLGGCGDSSGGAKWNEWQ